MPIWDSISLSNWDGWNSATTEGRRQAEGSYKLGENDGWKMKVEAEIKFDPKTIVLEFITW